MLQWLHNFLIHLQNEEKLLADIAAFLDVCHEVGFKVNPNKSCFFTTEFKLYFKSISSEGVRFDRRNFEVLLKMKAPQTADQQQQLLCATNSMKKSIRDYARVMQPLQSLLEESCPIVGERTKRAPWLGCRHSEALDLVKKQLATAATLAPPKEGYRTCLCTEASDTHWARILTKSPNNDKHKDIEDQIHEPLWFLSCFFSPSSERWSVLLSSVGRPRK